MLNIKIDDSAFGGPAGTVHDISRYSTRGILIDGMGKVAMMLTEVKGRCKLPGGGIELGENERDAFIRQIAEETGLNCEILETIGYIEEHKLRSNFRQYSYVFLARETGELEESSDGTGSRINTGIAWMPLDKAIAAMQGAINMENNSYSMKFMLLRDKLILEYARDNCAEYFLPLPATL